METLEKLNLWKVVSSSSTLSSVVCQNVLRQLVQASEKYDVIVDNGRVILSEKS